MYQIYKGGKRSNIIKYNKSTMYRKRVHVWIRTPIDYRMLNKYGSHIMPD